MWFPRWADLLLLRLLLLIIIIVIIVIIIVATVLVVEATVVVVTTVAVAIIIVVVRGHQSLGQLLNTVSVVGVCWRNLTRTCFGHLRCLLGCSRG